MEYFVIVYLVIALLLGFLATGSKRFKGYSFWKQLLVLSISPLLALRELIYILGDKDVKNS
jgi:hypothetical protein